MKAEVKEFFNKNYKDENVYNYKKIINHVEYLISIYEKMNSTEKVILYDLCFGIERNKNRGEKQSRLRKVIKISKATLLNEEFTKSMFTLIFLLRNFLRKSKKI